MGKGKTGTSKVSGRIEVSIYIRNLSSHTLDCEGKESQKQGFEKVRIG